MLYYITDYFTDEIIDVVGDFDTACRICDDHLGSQIETETDEVLYTNIELPF